MPRPLVTGNGNLLVCLDREFSIRDLYWPHVGLHNHLSGNRARIGLWVDGRFAWLSDSGWHRTYGYVEGSLATDAVATHSGLGVTVRLNDCVLPEYDVLLRRITVYNHTDRPRSAKLFLAHDFHIAETDIADTAFYNPYLDAIIHYKRDVYLLLAARCGTDGICQYATGIKGFQGAEGTWRDAEDGDLSMNPVAQGSVDSVLSVCVDIPPQDEARIDAWICAGHDLAEVSRLHEMVADMGFDTLMDSAASTQQIWSLREAGRLKALPDPIPQVFRRSLLTIRANTDNHGAIIAANDSDIMETARAHYSYMWPRDGALVSAAVDRLGCEEISRHFFLFCREALPSDRAAFMHKYLPDRSWGATWHPWIVEGRPEVPFQEDSTALVVWALHRHYERYRNREMLAWVYPDLVARCAEFMLSHRNPETGLPLPSYDLWEERRGVHAFTCASVFAALNAAAALASEIGDEREGAFREGAEEVQRGMEVHLWDEASGRFARCLVETPNGYKRDLTMDSALYAIWRFGAFPADDPRVQATMKRIITRLWVQTDVGGVARYEDDYYFRRSGDIDRIPGNPWFICTLWAAQWYIAQAKSRKELSTGLELLMWAARRAMSSGILPEQLHPETGEPLSVAPLTWSHAEFITTALDYLDRWDSLPPIVVDKAGPNGL